MSLPLFFSDLDHTMIFSRRALQRYKDATVGTVVVEDFLNEPLSYMDLDVWQYLSSESGVNYQFIPTTTRTLAQYDRVIFPSPPELAIVQNGAKIIIEGVEDAEWTNSIKEIISKIDVTPESVHENILRRFPSNTHKRYGIKTILNVDNTFTCIVGLAENSWEVIKYAKDLAATSGYTFSQQGRKLYLIPTAVSKENAIAEIMRRKQPKLTFASGDSILDAGMASYVDHFILPKHGDTLSNQEDNMITTESTGLGASKEILETIWGLIHKQ